jgi:hypothetical protein
MTKDEAMKIAAKVWDDQYCTVSGRQIELLIALDLLKVEKPVEPNQRFLTAMGDVPVNQRDVGNILAVINHSGLKLVEK